MVDSVYIAGRVKVQQWRKGKLLYQHQGSNIVTEGAFEQIAQILGGGAISLPSHIAMGSDGTFPDPSETTLNAELERQVAGKAFIGRQVTYTATMGDTFGDPTTVREAGIFDAATAGVLWTRFLTGQIDFFPGDSLDIEWELTIGSIV